MYTYRMQITDLTISGSIHINTVISTEVSHANNDMYSYCLYSLNNVIQTFLISDNVLNLSTRPVTFTD